MDGRRSGYTTYSVFRQGDAVKSLIIFNNSCKRYVTGTYKMYNQWLCPETLSPDSGFKLTLQLIRASYKK